MSSSKTVTGSHLIGKALQLEGVSNIFTLAGDHNLPTLNAFSDMDFRIIDTRHEAAAVHMAAEDEDWLEHEVRPAVDRRGRLVGCIGYGDLRRALMAGAGATASTAGDRSALDTMVLLETGLTGTMTALLAGRSAASGTQSTNTRSTPSTRASPSARRCSSSTTA